MMIVNNKYMLSENLTGAVTVYLILKKLMAPWTDWDAFKLKIIDKDGNKLRHPITSKERDAWDMLTRFCWNLKKISSKFIGKGQFATWFTASMLLKDSLEEYTTHNIQKLNENALKNITFSTQNKIYHMTYKVVHMIPKIDYINLSEDEKEVLLIRMCDVIEKNLTSEELEDLAKDIML